MLILVSVNDLRVRIPVGFYPEEITLKTDVFITVKVKYQSHSIDDDLNKTIDYQKIGEAVKQLSQASFKLLETFAEKLIEQLSSLYAHLDLQCISVAIKKMHILEAGIDAQSHEVFVEKNEFQER
jgi:FolB domain-containing protein